MDRSDTVMRSSYMLCASAIASGRRFLSMGVSLLTATTHTLDALLIQLNWTRSSSMLPCDLSSYLPFALAGSRGTVETTLRGYWVSDRLGQLCIRRSQVGWLLPGAAVC